MNYRHVYHAGNFADVLKHAVLARLIVYLQNKDKAFRILDTHAGIGLYDLSSTEAQKTGEWQGGIGKILEADLPAPVADLLAPWLDAVRSLNPDGGLKTYPGSPMLARMLMRPQDRLSAIELHPDDSETLRRLFEGDHQVRVTGLDGWLTLGAHLPPKEKRGLVLVDPPFEVEGEFDRLVDGLAKAWRRFPGGVYCLWYPVKDGAPPHDFTARLKALAIPRMMRVELAVKAVRKGEGLAGSGLIIVNPPFTLEAELAVILPVLTRLMALDNRASHHVSWLTREDVDRD